MKPINKTALTKILMSSSYALVVATLFTGCSSPESTQKEGADHSQMQHDMPGHDMSGHDMQSMHADGGHEGMQGHVDMNPTEPAEALGQDYSIYQAGGDWTNQDGQAVSLDDLKGNNQVVAMAYTSCQHTCPILVRSMKQIASELSPEAKAQTKFLIVSLDPDRDSVEVLKNYTKHNELGENWQLLRGSASDVRMLANTLNIKYAFANNGDINHSNFLSVLDKEGRLVAQEVGVSDAGIKPLIEYLNTKG